MSCIPCLSGSFSSFLVHGVPSTKLALGYLGMIKENHEKTTNTERDIYDNIWVNWEVSSSSAAIALSITRTRIFFASCSIAALCAATVLVAV